MMILLEIIKWIGCLFLWLLLILSGVLLLILFLPIRYQGYITCRQEEKQAGFYARWFLGLLRLKVIYNKETEASVRFLWIVLWRNGQETTSEKEESDEEAVSAENDDSSRRMERFREHLCFTTKKRPTQKKRGTEKKEPVQEEKGIGTREKILYYKDVLSEQETKEFLTDMRKVLLRLWKSIHPKKLRLKGVFGFEAPDVTGYAYGVYCMIFGQLGKNVVLIPDFEKQCLELSGSIKGRITIFTVVRSGLRIYFDRRFIRLMEKLKKGGR